MLAPASRVWQSTGNCEAFTPMLNITNPLSRSVALMPEVADQNIPGALFSKVCHTLLKLPAEAEPAETTATTSVVNYLAMQLKDLSSILAGDQGCCLCCMLAAEAGQVMLCNNNKLFTALYCTTSSTALSLLRPRRAYGSRTEI